MIELALVRRMARRGMVASPVVVAALWLAGGPRQAAAAAVGIALALLNLWIAARVIGGISENRPELLLVAAFAAFAAGLALVIVAGVVLNRLDVIPFETVGLTFVGAHLTLAVWEAADAFLRIDPSKEPGGARPRAPRTSKKTDGRTRAESPSDSVAARS